ncbi:MAG: hypothetical protein AAF236_12660, partial [Verrucomicrobiota bacterium]
ISSDLSIIKTEMTDFNDPFENSFELGVSYTTERLFEDQEESEWFSLSEEDLAITEADDSFPSTRMSETLTEEEMADQLPA